MIMNKPPKRTVETINAMVEYFRGDVKRIQHFMKVYTIAKTLAINENSGDYPRYRH